MWALRRSLSCYRMMVNFCVITGCRNRSDKEKGLHFYRLPAVVVHQGHRTHDLSKRRRDRWLTLINRDDLSPQSYPYIRVCSKHFISGKSSTLYDTKNPDWAPSKFLVEREGKMKKNKGTRTVTRTNERRKRRRRMNEARRTKCSQKVLVMDTEPPTRDVACQTIMTHLDVTRLLQERAIFVQKTQQKLDCYHEQVMESGSSASERPTNGLSLECS